MFGPAVTYRDLMFVAVATQNFEEKYFLSVSENIMKVYDNYSRNGHYGTDVKDYKYLALALKF